MADSKSSLDCGNQCECAMIKNTFKCFLYSPFLKVLNDQYFLIPPKKGHLIRANQRGMGKLLGQGNELGQSLLFEFLLTFKFPLKTSTSWKPLAISDLQYISDIYHCIAMNVHLSSFALSLHFVTMLTRVLGTIWMDRWPLLLDPQKERGSLSLQNWALGPRGRIWDRVLVCLRLVARQSHKKRL